MPKISLLSFLLLITIFAIGLQHWLTVQKLETANNELAKLHNEVGHLDVTDPNKIQIVQIPTQEPYRWRWRIRIPDGMDVDLFAARGLIPAQGFSIDLDRSHEMLLGNAHFREFVLDIQIWEDTGGNSGLLFSYNNSSESTMKMTKPLPSMFGSGKWEETVTGIGKTEEQELVGRFSILRLRHSPNDLGLAEGFLFWLNDRNANDSAQKAAKE